MLSDLVHERAAAQEAVAEIVRELSQVVRDSRGVVTAAARPLIERLLERPDLLTLGTANQPIHGESAQWLYYDTQVGVSLGRTRPEAVPAHDHGGWQVFSLYQGSMEYISYRQREGDGPGEAVLEVIDQTILRAGDAITVGVPPEDVHEWRPLEPDTYVLGVLPMDYSNVRRYFRGLDLGKQLERGSLINRSYFDRPASQAQK